MASGIFAILDDVATLLDDAAAISKIAARKTAGLLGDDLAVNAEKATGFQASRELPVLWAITKGSLLNKLIILPVAFLLSAFMPWLIVPILLIGGCYLSYEGAEKVIEWITGQPEKAIAARDTDDSSDIIERERNKIRSAVRTDFILSIEIIVITLGTVIAQTLMIQVLVVSLIALLATVGVYGLVAIIVRMDDTGCYMIESALDMQGRRARLTAQAGQLLINALPGVIRLLGIIGTIAMLLVGGGMFVHNIEVVHHALAFMPAYLAELVTGLIIGVVIYAIVHHTPLHRMIAADHH